MSDATTPEGTEMARWIDQTLHVNDDAEVSLLGDAVWIGKAEVEDRLPQPALFAPTTREDANAMAISLRMAAKRLEEIGKGLE